MATITLQGYSDDLISLGGDIDEEFSYLADEDADETKGTLVAFSDGTVLRIVFGYDVAWRITPVVHGSADCTIVQTTDEDGTDVATLTGDISWAVHGIAIAKAKS